MQTDLYLNKPQLEVAIDRDRASDLGVSVRDDRERAPDPARRPRSLDLQARRRDLRRDGAARATASATIRATCSSSTCAAISEQLVSLSAVVDARETIAPREVPHYDRQRSVMISADLATRTAGRGLEIATAIAERGAAGRDAGIRFVGEAEKFIGLGQRAALRLRARDRGGLPGAGGAVRELRAPGDDPGGGGALLHRRAGRAARDPDHAEPLQQDRPRDAGRPGHEELDPDRRVREPAARARAAAGRGGRSRPRGRASARS